MNKNQLIRELANGSFLKNSEAKAVVNKLISIIGDTLKEGEDVNISGLGKIYLYTHKPRPVRNPKTNEPMTLPEFKSIKFKPSSGLNNTIKKITRVDDGEN